MPDTPQKKKAIERISAVLFKNRYRLARTEGEHFLYDNIAKEIADDLWPPKTSSGKEET